MPAKQSTLEIIVDSRESLPWQWQPEVAAGEVVLVRAALKTGDYAPAAPALRELCAIERKSLQDLAGCVGGGRDRFRAQFERLARLRWPLIIVEASIAGIAKYRSRAHACDRRQILPAHIIGTMMSWSLELGVPWLPGGSVRQCERLALRHLRAAARLRARELRSQ